jgi:hypothetical protein
MLQSIAARLTRVPRPKYTPAGLVSVFGRRAASPLHVRRLASDSLPEGVSSKPLSSKDKASFYRYYLGFDARNSRNVQLQPWITRLPPSDQNTGESLRVLDDAQSRVGR